MRQFGIAAKLLSKVYETLLAPETCEQEDVGEFKGVTFKIAKSQTPLAELGRAYNPLRVTTVYATEYLRASVRGAYKPLQAALVLLSSILRGQGTRCTQ